MSIQKLVRANIRNLVPYSSARDENKTESIIQLDANESPYESPFNRYPDPYQSDLKTKISEIKGVSTSNIFIGNGSDEIIDLIIRAFCEPKVDSVMTLEPSYGMYRVSAGINAVDFKTFSLNEDFDLIADDLLLKLGRDTKVVFLCSPNNPTGNSFKEDEIEKLLNTYSGIVVLDEAYIDFSTKNSWTNRLDEFTQLVVLQTLSKSFGMAGLRLGLGFCSIEIKEVLNKIKPPYNINSMSQTIAIEALNNRNEIEELVNQINREKAFMIESLGEFSNVLKIYPSDANFLLVKFRDAKAIYDYLITKGIVVRNRSSEFGCENCLRISIGLPEENRLLINCLKEFKK